MKPKYEIDQTIYFKTNPYKIIGVKRESVEDPRFIYFLIDIDYRVHKGPWIPEEELTPDNKKYYILYRSADGLEKTDEIQATDNLHGAGITRTRHLKCSGPRCSLAKGQRKYQFVSKTTNWDSLTETYIYDEVI